MYHTCIYGLRLSFSEFPLFLKKKYNCLINLNFVSLFVYEINLKIILQQIAVIHRMM